MIHPVEVHILVGPAFKCDEAKTCEDKGRSSVQTLHVSQ